MRWLSTFSLAATRSWSACSIATGTNWVSRRFRPSSTRRREPRSVSSRVRPPRCRSHRSQINGRQLEFRVDVRNLTGHKFPTGYPSRRAWLHVTVRSGDALVFESGAVDGTGAIRGNDNDVDPRRYEPHYEQITQSDQVQIYEPILGDRSGTPTTGLLTATQYLKDNRLLPRGFEKSTAPAEIAVYGLAANDADFSAERRSGPLRSRCVWRRAVHCAGGAPLPVDRVPMGAQPGRLRRARTETLRLLLSIDVVDIVGPRGHRDRTTGRPTVG